MPHFFSHSTSAYIQHSVHTHVHASFINAVFIFYPVWHVNWFIHSWSIN